GPAVAYAVLDHVVQDAGDHGILVASVAGEDNRDVGGMREVRQARALPDLPVVVLRREGERVIEAVGVSGHGWEVNIATGARGCTARVRLRELTHDTRAQLEIEHEQGEALHDHADPRADEPEAS